MPLRDFSRCHVIVAICSTVLLAGSALSADWTQFRGPSFGAANDAKVPVEWNGASVIWKTPLEGRGASSPVTFGDRVYLTYYTGYGIDIGDPGDPSSLVRHLMCIDLKEGKVLWTKAVASDSENNPFTVWAVALHGFASSTPAIDKTGVYVFFGATGVLAFSHEGEELWRTQCGTGTHSFGAGNSPVLYKDFVIVNASVESGDLIALNKADGKEVWRQSGIEQSWNTPAIYQTPEGSTELALTIKGKILGFNPDDGTPLWNCSGTVDYICPSIVAQDGILFATGGRTSKMIAIRSGGRGDVSETHKLWEIDRGSNVSSPVYYDGHLYWTKDNGGIAYCADVKTGELVYEQRLKPSPGLIYASPLLAAGRLYYVSRENGIYVVPAKPEFELLAHTKFEGDDSIFNASPVPVSGGGVLLRSDKYLYRIGAAK